MARRGAGAPASEATTRERILEVALDLFVRKGYAGTSLREIAAELGFSKAALYYHYESKQDILLALHLRVHSLTDEALPLLQTGNAVDDGTWLRLVDVLIGVTLRNRRLLELHLRNRDAIGDLHKDPANIEKHGPIRDEVQDNLLGMIGDRSVPAERRIRRVASLGTVAAVLLGSGALADVSDADLEAALRTVVQDVLGTIA